MCYLLIVYQVNLVEHDAVSKSKLFHGFVFNPFRFFIVEMLNDMFCIDHGDDSIQIVILGNSLISKECLSNGRRICKPCGFNDDPIEILDSVVHVVENFRQIAAYSTADATVHHFDDAFF
ncbi:MAG TPA: hypothetical protein D7H78_02305 [Candidatus Poseidoniales archaeon]|nr:MAG TPA: hypothetical protein D7H78_02305 [Candidatus Poseidoniales archaeon]